MGVTVKTDLSRIKSRIQAGVEAAEKAVAEQVLNDGNEFVKVDQGTLRDSGRVEPYDGVQAATWNTKYAARQYYTGTPSKDVNPNASLQWAEKAKRKYKSDWETVAQKAFEEGMK